MSKLSPNCPYQRTAVSGVRVHISVEESSGESYLTFNSSNPNAKSVQRNTIGSGIGPLAVIKNTCEKKKFRMLYPVTMAFCHFVYPSAVIVCFLDRKFMVAPKFPAIRFQPWLLFHHLRWNHLDDFDFLSFSLPPIHNEREKQKWWEAWKRLIMQFKPTQSVMPFRDYERLTQLLKPVIDAIRHYSSCRSNCLPRYFVGVCRDIFHFLFWFCFAPPSFTPSHEIVFDSPSSTHLRRNWWWWWRILSPH